MNREERIRAVLEGKQPDRVPVSVWMHLSEYDQDSRSLAEAMVAFNEKYDYDFIKMMPFGAYMTPDWGAKLKIFCDPYKEVEIIEPAITCPEDYEKLEVLAPTHGSWGRTLQLAQWTSKLIKPNTPYMQTIFSPATSLKKLAGARLLSDMLEHPDKVHHALEVITETTIHFVKANIEAGVSGFFFATQLANYDMLSDTLYAEFCKPYDLRVISSYNKETWFNVVHIHGKNIMFDTLEKYPLPILNWHDRQTEPDFKTAREKTNKVFMGGLKEGPAIVGTALKYDSIMSTEGMSEENIKKHIREAIEMAGGKGLIVAPGCVADPKSPEALLKAVRAAVENS